MADLRQPLFESEYLPNAIGRGHMLSNDRNLEERLAAAKMIASIDDQRATVLGLLVLGTRPRDFLPGAYVQFLRIGGRDLSDPIRDELAVEGSIADIVRRMEEKFVAHNLRQVDLGSQDRERRTDLYPRSALQQIVRNALMHRTYEATNAPVRVTWFDDRIEFQNPGGPFGMVTESNFGQPGVTDYRNPNLAEAMKVLEFVQRFGVGIPTARRALRDAGHPDIEFTVETEHLLATVRAVRRTTGGMK